MSVDDGLRALFRRHLPLVHWQSIESGSTGRGVPDSNYCYQGCEGWIECKATKAYGVTLRPEQIGWIARRVRAGGRVHVAVRRRHGGGPRLGPPVDELWIFHGRYVKTAKLYGLRSPAMLGVCRVWHGGPARWDWDGVLGAITS